jgi:hypothetical protein
MTIVIAIVSIGYGVTIFLRIKVSEEVSVNERSVLSDNLLAVLSYSGSSSRRAPIIDHDFIAEKPV